MPLFLFFRYTVSRNYSGSVTSVETDVGSVATKATAYDGEKIIVTALMPTNWSPKKSGEKLLKDILCKI